MCRARRIKQWEEGANEEMQEEGELINDILKRLRRDSQLKKVGQRTAWIYWPCKELQCYCCASSCGGFLCSIRE